MALHRLKTLRHVLGDHQCATDIYIRGDRHFESGKRYSETVGDYSHSRVQASGKRSTENVPRIGQIMVPTNSVVDSEGP